MTLLNQFSCNDTKILCPNGGNNNEIFNFEGEFNHTKPASSIVSSSRGMIATIGKIQISNNGKSFNLHLDPSEGASMSVLHNESFHNRTLSRVIFSMKEMGDTAKFPSNFGNFSLTATTYYEHAL